MQMNLLRAEARHANRSRCSPDICVHELHQKRLEIFNPLRMSRVRLNEWFCRRRCTTSESRDRWQTAPGASQKGKEADRYLGVPGGLRGQSTLIAGDGYRW